MMEQDAAMPEHHQGLRTMLEKLEIPKKSPFTLSIDGKFSDLFRLKVQGSHVQFVLNSGVADKNVVVRLLLSY